ncbi:hypothetical protein JG687_00011139 [Phytophthora cactorum]|uniref:Uncharacterized protein n=1 Tax=Phytophthora cactorum TaxID=29920 RepID=A0A8T1U5D9_9STRA|nr:hypothetical protein GQ600_867 [Phytophthora cactorum]KAG6955554.1 hypothetical protein JG687_00011139 [Phytophthora cactorum]
MSLGGSAVSIDCCGCSAIAAVYVVRFPTLVATLRSATGDVASSGATTNRTINGDFNALPSKLNCIGLGVKSLSALTRERNFCCEPDTAAPADSADTPSRQDTRKWHIELCSDAAAIKLIHFDARKTRRREEGLMLRLRKLGSSQVVVVAGFGARGSLQFGGDLPAGRSESKL